MGSNPTVICLKTLQWLWAEHLGGLHDLTAGHIEVGASDKQVRGIAFVEVVAGLLLRRKGKHLVAQVASIVGQGAGLGGVVVGHGSVSWEIIINPGTEGGQAILPGFRPFAP